MGRISKTLSEGEACVSAEPETGKRAHGVRDAVFAFRPIRAGSSGKRTTPLSEDAGSLSLYHCRYFCPEGQSYFRLSATWPTSFSDGLRVFSPGFHLAGQTSAGFL